MRLSCLAIAAEDREREKENQLQPPSIVSVLGVKSLIGVVKSPTEKRDYFMICNLICILKQLSLRCL